MKTSEPTVMLIVNRFCLGCQQVKTEVMTAARVRAALEGLSYSVVDTATPEGAAVAAERRVDEVPVLICTDASGREVFRSGDLDTEGKVLLLLNRLRETSAAATTRHATPAPPQ